jgi:hypothetical protein
MRARKGAASWCWLAAWGAQLTRNSATSLTVSAWPQRLAPRRTPNTQEQGSSQVVMVPPPLPPPLAWQGWSVPGRGRRRGQVAAWV